MEVPGGLVGAMPGPAPKYQGPDPCTVTLGPCEVVGKGSEGGQEGMAGHSPKTSPPPALPHEPVGLLDVWSAVPEMFLYLIHSFQGPVSVGFLVLTISQYALFHNSFILPK